MLLHQNFKSCLFFAFRLVSFVPHGVQLIELKPPPFLRWMLKNIFLCKLKLDYLERYLKLKNCFHRLQFLSENDKIPDFLRFRLPEIYIFSNMVVQCFQLKLLRTEKKG